MTPISRSSLVLGIMAALIGFFWPQGSKTLLSQFDKLMGEVLTDKTQYCKQDFIEYIFYKDQYLKGYEYLLKSQEIRTPKILHFIWLGPASFPQESIQNVLSWKKYHPDWTIKFWTDDPSRICPVDGMQKHLIQDLDKNMRLTKYLSQTKNWGEKSDLLRYEILYKEGGVYVDHDVECFRSFDPLSTYDFFAGIEPFENIADMTKFSIGNCLIGTSPQHPILNGAIDFVEQNWQRVGDKFPGDDSFSNLMRVLQRTFMSLRISAREHLNENNHRDIVLPPTFFFAPYLTCPDSLKEELKSKDLLFAFHKWDGFWMDDVIIKEIRASKKQEEINKFKIAEVKIDAGSLKKEEGILRILQGTFFLMLCAVIASRCNWGKL